jgi:hypothetical protein
MLRRSRKSINLAQKPVKTNDSIIRKHASIDHDNNNAWGLMAHHNRKRNSVRHVIHQAVYVEIGFN